MTSLAQVTPPDDDVTVPADLDEDELFEEIFVKPGLNLLTNIVLLARGYQHGSPRGVLAKALIVSALSEPETKFYSGMATTPLNLQIGFVGASGRGKGRAMSAPISPLNGKMWRKDTPASGEALINLFFDKVTEPKADGKGEVTLAVRHEDGVWIEWSEIDGYAAKAGKSNGTSSGGGANVTMDSHIRSLISGEAVGDKSLTRERQAVGSRLEPLSYRFCVTLGVQPRRAHPLIKDGGGGTLQRTIWIGVTDPDCPRTAADIRAIRDQLAKRLGMTTTPDDAPTLSVVGPGKVIVQPSIQDLILEDAATVASGSSEIADDDTHMNNLTIRLAAIFAGWVAHEKKPNGALRNGASVPFGSGFIPQSITATVDDAAWWWARCFMEWSRRDRADISRDARKGAVQEMHERGQFDAERQLAKNSRIDAAEEAEARKTLDRVVAVLEKHGGELDERTLLNFRLSKKQRKTYVDAREIGEAEGILIALPVAGKGTVIQLDRDRD